MNTNLTFNANGVTDGMVTILNGFQSTFDEFFTGDVLMGLVAILCTLVVLVGVWFGLKAILKAIFKAL